jgi:hypothetical protein
MISSENRYPLFGIMLYRSLPQGEFNMPSTVNLYQIGVWFCVGFFTGAGWAIASVIVGRVFAHV